jgi:hypothetical protein
VLVINKQEGWIGHRLNILGIRVWADNCRLVAQTGGEWIVLGPPRLLPLKVPTNVEELARAAHDPLLITAYQYVTENPGTDLADLLAQRKDFQTALNVTINPIN